MNARANAVSLTAALSFVLTAAWPAAAAAQYSATGEPAASDELQAQIATPQVIDAPAPAQPIATDATAGQWVYTQQYGWIWMPYSDAYTSVPADGYGQPYQYVYYPAYSAWTWIVAPWVWGLGPWPHFGVYGPARYAWYGHGWWRTPAHWHYAPRYYGGHAFHGVAPAPVYRGGYARPPAYAPRGYAAPRGAQPAPRAPALAPRGYAAPRTAAFAPRGGYVAPRAPAFAPRGGSVPQGFAPARSGFVGRAPAGGGFAHAPAARVGGGFGGGGHARAAGGGHGGHR